MMNRVINLIFIDFFALAINITLGTVLRSKICNYSWDSVYPMKKINYDESESTDILEPEGTTTN